MLILRPCSPCQVPLQLVSGSQLVHSGSCLLHAGSGLEAELHPGAERIRLADSLPEPSISLSHQAAIAMLHAKSFERAQPEASARTGHARGCSVLMHLNAVFRLIEAIHV